MSSHQPLVSILINNYNYGGFIAEAIESALNQTYPHLEIIVVDDGSTDNSRDIIKNYQGKIIPIFKENGGQASAFNVGFAASQGDIICFLDADDLFVPEKIAETVEMFNQYPQTDWFFHPLEYLGQDLDSTPVETDPASTRIYDLRHSIEQGKLKGSFPFGTATSGICFKRSLLNKILPMPEAIRITSDDYIKYVALGLSPGCVCLRKLAIQRIHGNNAYTFQKGKIVLVIKIQFLTADAIKTNFPAFRQFADNLVSLGMNLSWKYQGNSLENNDLLKQYLASTPLLQQIKIYAKAMYYSLKR